MRNQTHLTARIAVAAAVLAVAVVALSPTEARAQARMPTHVACVGDSITYGYAASSSSKSYPSDLQGLFGTGVMVRNFGRNSATMLSIGDLPYINQSEYTAATTFVSGAGANAVVDVIIMLGTNDSKSYNWNPSGTTRAQQFMTDTAAIVDHFTGLSTRPVVYLAIPAAIYTNTFGISETVTYNEIAPIIRQVAMQKGMPIIDVHAATAGHPEYFSDGVHPTDAGYMLVAQVMHDGLLRVPTVAITMPAANASIVGTSVGISANASGGTVPITSVQFFRGATSIATVTQSPFMTTWTNAAPGPYTLTAKATDNTGAAATSAPVSITVAGGAGAGGTGGGAGGASGAAGAGGGAAGRGGAAGGAAGRGGSSGGSSGGAAGSAAGGGAGSAGGAAGSAAGGGGGAAGSAAGGGAGGAGGATAVGGGGGGATAGSAGGASGAGAAGTAGAGTTGTGGAGVGGGGGSGDGGGCGCSLHGEPRSAFAVLGLLLIALARRRPRSRR